VSLVDWLSLAAVCLLGAASPGPSLAVVVRHTLQSGRAAGVKVGLAHGAGVGLYAVAVVSGLALLITTSPTLYTGLQWAGAAFLAYLGVKALRSSGDESTGDSGQQATGRPALEGFSIAFLNPKLAIFFLALFSQFLDPDASLAGKAVMVMTMAVIDAGWYCGMAMLLGHPGLLSRLQASRQVIDRVFGVVLLALAVRIFLTS
jgi:threonine/homoserine/homoserine lactone efflux protein